MHLTEWLKDVPLVWMGVMASLVAGLAAGVGALPVLAVRNISRKTHDVLLGFSAGVMLAASAFSLLVPALEVVAQQGQDKIAGAVLVGVGLMVGAIALSAVHQWLPHEHFIKGPEGGSAVELRRMALFILAITLHNFPEGLAVGVGFGGGDVANGLALTAGIFLQNLPEGFVVAIALAGLGYAPSQAVMAALATGVVETLGGFVGAGAVSLASAVLPWGLSSAAGAMVFVISHEVIPETHRHGHETPATFGLMVGFALMMVLDVALGG